MVSDSFQGDLVFSVARDLRYCYQEVLHHHHSAVLSQSSS